MSQIVQHYTDVAMTLKEYPITVPAAIPISETKDLDDFINETPSEAPQDGKIYGRKNGAWVEAADENLATDVSTLVRNLSYYVCEAEPEDNVRLVGDGTYVASVEGYSHKVLMRNSYTGNEKGIKYSFFGVSKLIIYNGAPVTSTNTWIDGEIVEVSLIDNRWIATPLYVHAQGNLTVVDLGVILDTNKISWPNQHPYLLSHRHTLSSHFRELSLPEIGGVRVDCFGHGLTMDEDLNELVKVGNYYSIVSHDADDINSDKLEGFWSYDSLVLFGPDFNTVIPTILGKDAAWWSETIKTAFDEDIRTVINTMHKSLSSNIDKKADMEGKFPNLWSGMSDRLAPTEKTEQAAYRDEVLPSGRILGFAPELGPDGAGTRDGQIADEVSPVMREVWGDVIGGNQMVNPARVTRTGIVYENNAIELNGTNASYQYIHFKETTVGRKHLLLIHCNYVEGSKNVGFFGCLQKGGAGWNDPNAITFNSTSERTLSKIVTPIEGYNMIGFAIADANSKGRAEYATALDLQTLFPTDTSFVTSLTKTDAIKVAHRLGFLALQRD